MHVAQTRPYQVQFKTDADEVIGAAAEATNEQDGPPGGIVGFALRYAHQDC